jgi:hypothetical protein
MTDTTKGGLDNDDVWGDVDDPLAELDKMNDDNFRDALGTEMPDSF